MLKHTIMFVAVMCVVLGLTSSAPANNWHDTEHPPVTTGNLWSNDANWTDPGTPTTGMSFRIEQYAADAAGTGTIIMDVDYSAGALNTAEFFGCETVSMQNYFKVTGVGLRLVNGGNGPTGSYVRFDPTGTHWGNVAVDSSASRPPPTIDFAGGDWAAGNLRYGNEQRSIFKVSSAAGSITPGAIQVTNAPSGTDPNRWPTVDLELAATGIAPVTLTDADPLQFTGTAAGTNPFKLTVDVTAYTGAASSIPLFIFSGGTEPTDRMFADPGNITITQTTPGQWWVTQSDTGVTLVPEPATLALLAFGGLGVLLRRKRR